MILKKGSHGIFKAYTSFCSCFARSLQAASFARPVTKRAFQPIKTNFAPSLSARFASTDSAKDGRIHQVIGAVVDGMFSLDLEGDPAI